MAEFVWSEQDTTPGAHRGRAARAAPAAARRGRVRPRARAQPDRGRRPRVARRDREPARARRPLPPVAHDHLLDRARAGRRSTRSPSLSGPGRQEAGRARDRVGDRDGRLRPRARAAPRRARRRAGGDRPAVGRLVAAPAPRGGRRAAAARAGRADRLGRGADADATPSRARTGWPRTPTSSTSRGCARRRGASGSRRRSTRRCGGPSSAKLAKITVGTTRTRAIAGLLLFGWLCSRLGWEPGSFVQQNGSLHGAREHAAARRSTLSPRAGAAPGGAGPRRPHDRDRVRHAAVARPRPGRPVRDARRERRPPVRVDRARRVARRGGDPRRGNPPGAAARSRPTGPRSRRRARWCSERPGGDRPRRPRGRGRGAARRRRGRAAAHIALAGGSTPRRAYEQAAELEADWSHATLWFGDERCVPPDARALELRDGAPRAAEPPRHRRRRAGGAADGGRARARRGRRARTRRRCARSSATPSRGST